MENLARASAAPVRIAAFVLLACSSLFACAPDPGPAAQALVAVLPGAPTCWASLPELCMELRWTDAEGRSRTLPAFPGERVPIELERGRPQAVLARPSSRGLELDPAGALYPAELAASAGSRELVLDWTGGYVASVALDLEKAGLDPWVYDLSRLAAEAAVRSSDLWTFPPLEVARRLAEGSFRIDLFREGVRHSACLPGPGPWAPESPFAEAPIESGEGATAFLSEGLWRFVGEGRELLVEVDSGGGSRYVLGPEPRGRSLHYD